MTLRTRLFIIISLIVLILLGISLFLFSRGGKTPISSSDTQTTPAASGELSVPSQPGQTPAAPGTTPAPNPAPPMTAEEAEQNGVRLLAKVFIERFQSYSTDANFQNVKEIETMVTPALWKKLSSKITASQSSAPFVGVTTEVIVSSLKDWNLPNATVNIKTRATTEKNGAVTNSYPEFSVSLVKSGNNWLVDSFAKQ